MTTPAGELQQLLAQARTLDGWTVSRLDGGAHRVTSPQGTTLVPATTPVTEDLVIGILDEFSTLGFDRDFRTQPRRDQQAKHEQAARAALVTPTSVPAVGDHTKHEEPQNMAKTEDGLLRLTVRQALPDLTRNGGNRYEKKGVVLTPAIAAAFAEVIDRTHNRGERRANRAKFKRIILEGKFVHTHQGLAFNINGQLADGQHRVLGYLDAIEENPDIVDDPNFQVVVDITYNMPITAAYAMDGGATRSAKDHAAVAGIDQPSKTTPLVQLHYRYWVGRERPQSWQDIQALLPDEVPVLCEKYGPGLVESYDAVRAVLATNPPLKASKPNLPAVAVFHYLAHTRWDGFHSDGSPWGIQTDAKGKPILNEEGQELLLHPVDDFLHAVAEDTRRRALSPQKALYNWCLGIRDDNKKANPQTYLAMFLIAYRDFCTRGERKNMQWRPASGIPLPYRPVDLE